MSDIDPRALRTAFGAFMTGVTVVTTRDAEGNPLGFTANSFSSVSLDPPLILVCLADTSSNYDAFANTQGFAVNVLSEDQKAVSNTFARPVEDRFSAVDWRDGPVGSPVFEGVSAWFDCTMYKRITAGDHLILIGQVGGFDTAPVAGLGYARGAYVTASVQAEALNSGANLTVSALIEKAGHLLLVDDGQGGLRLPEVRVAKDGTSAALNRLIKATGVTAEPGFVYSIYEDGNRDHQHISFLCQATDGQPAAGAFRALDSTTLAGVTDPALRVMLTRFAAESRMGNFGIYVGNQISGEVRPITRESKDVS